MNAQWAVTRSISSQFQDALLTIDDSLSIDTQLARRQHRHYSSRIAETGIPVIELPELKGFPDCCFVEDCAVVADGVAVVTIPGTLSRQGEEPPVANALLQQGLELFQMQKPGTLEGGDCMLVGRTLFVGRSTRTNDIGIDFLRQIFERRGFKVRVLDVPAHLLHLKCVCSALDEERVLMAKDSFDSADFAPFHVVPVPIEEAYAANCVSVNGTTLLAAGFPRTGEILENLGYKIRTVDMSEIRKANGSLTCLSLLG